MFGISNFFRNTEQPLGFKESYSEESLLEAVSQGWELRSSGYREGVALVPIDPKHMRTSVVRVSPDMVFTTVFESRVPGEEPRQKTRALIKDLPFAKSASVVVYHSDVLAEDDDRTTSEEWEIITILAHAEEYPEPMNPGTLMSNHFHVDGGTSTKMSPEEFEKALRESFLFWRGHALAQKA